MIEADKLHNMRQHGDDLAAAVVDRLTSLPKEAEMEALSLFRQLAHTTDAIPPALPDFVGQYFTDNETLPSWADNNKIKLASRVFSQYGPEIVLVLFCKSLPLSYSCAKGAEVLLQTGRLTRESKKDLPKLNRRVMETAQFVLNVMEPRGFGRKGKAIRTAQKIRLIHATIRHFLIQQDWPTGKYGVPINQQDLAGTMMSFSWIILDGLRQLGVQLSEQEQDAYIHSWNVIGHYIGVEESLMPANVNEAKSLTEAILADQQGPSEAGTLLTASLIDYMSKEFFIWPFRCFPAMLMRRLVGEQTADMLEIPRNACHIGDLLLRLAERVFATVYRVENKAPLLRKVVGFLTRKMLQKMVLIYNHEKRVRFIIPPSLTGQWDVDTPETTNVEQQNPGK